VLIGLAVVALSLSLFAGAADARSRTQSGAGVASLTVTGWGNVTLAEELGPHRTLRCTGWCPGERYSIHARRVVLVERPYPGWKFVRWQGACRSTSAKCVIDASRKRHIRVAATFVAVGAGWTQAHPIPLGTTASIGSGFRVRVNSALVDPQLSPPAPAGEEYVAANVTVTYTGPSEGDVGGIVWTASGYTVTAAGDPPYAAPQPALDYLQPLLPGQSTTGYICWRVVANQVSGLGEFSVGAFQLPYRATWFALR
jgi:hypothetical protein